VPLNRPALSLGTGARGVQDARTWITVTLRDLDREDLLECAEMAVSEVVTNALLHGAPPIHVRVRGTREHPRVEVSDGSTEPPSLPTPVAALRALDALDDSHDALDGLDGLGIAGIDADAIDEVLLTFGRGLSIVARASDAWGAEIEEDGKTVWFTPTAEFSDEGTEGVITGAVEPSGRTGEQPADPVKLRLVGVPARDYVTFHNHVRELRREVRLLALANEDDYPLARDLAEGFTRLGRPFTHDRLRAEVDTALAAGRSTADLEVLMGRDEARGVARFIELLALTDAFAREEKMLALARTERQVRFQTWFLGEIVRQADGHAPRPWVGDLDQSADAERRSSVS
jgi:anti-sigma regulatory factor (Ser/Thr protein kinase)